MLYSPVSSEFPIFQPPRKHRKKHTETRNEIQGHLTVTHPNPRTLNIVSIITVCFRISRGSVAQPGAGLSADELGFESPAVMSHLWHQKKIPVYSPSCRNEAARDVKKVSSSLRTRSVRSVQTNWHEWKSVRIRQSRNGIRGKVTRRIGGRCLTGRQMELRRRPKAV